MNQEEKKSGENRAVVVERKIDIELERLELDKQRLKLDVESQETSKRLDAARIDLEKSKERTAKLQILLPLLVSVFAIGLSVWTAWLQYKLQYNSAVSSYNQTRLELFKKMTERTIDSTELKTIYAEIFPNDFKILEGEQKTQKPGEK
jgi:hypothetical protein